MAKIGIISVGVLGRVHSSCEIARRLAARGHQLVLASVDPRAADHLRDTKLSFYQLSDGVTQDLRDALEHTPPGEARFQLRKAATRLRGESALRGHGIDGFLRSEQPDLLLVESELHNSILYLQRFEIPALLLEYHLSVRRRPGVPPLDSHLTPDPPFARLRSTFAWHRTMLSRRRKQLRDRRRHGPWDPHSVWKRLARDAGKDLSAIAVEDQWPFLFYPGIPRLNLCAPELDYSVPETDGGHFVGPVMQGRRNDPTRNEELGSCRSWLQERDPRRPLVVCATGSILTLPHFTERVIAAAQGEDFDLLLAAGRRADPSALAQPLPNVRVMRFIPQLDALAHASLFICHGGVASIHESLLAAVPLLVYSGGCMDENGNAARIQYHGLGLSAHMDREDCGEIRARIHALLRDGNVLRRVRDMRDTLRRYEIAQLLEQHIDEALTANAGRRATG